MSRVPARPALLRTVPLLGVLLLLTLAATACSQQVPDTTFSPPIARPDYAPGAGPVVAIDEGHSNFHTMGERYGAFARLVARDGYVVRPRGGRFTRPSLDSLRILVIANALDPRNREDWHVPIWPAFDSTEVAVVEQWVADGGSLLLVADHMPFGGAAAGLAAAFGVQMTNGFANDGNGQSTFTVRRADGRLLAHAITDGRGPGDRVDSITVFTGQAFGTTAKVDTLIAMGPGSYLLLPQEAWNFTKDTPRESAAGRMVAAALVHGRGRVVMLGEAAMLTAQLAGPKQVPMGMNAPYAVDHPRFVLNILRWLAMLP